MILYLKMEITELNSTIILSEKLYQYFSLRLSSDGESNWKTALLALVKQIHTFPLNNYGFHYSMTFNDIMFM